MKEKLNQLKLMFLIVIVPALYGCGGGGGGSAVSGLVSGGSSASASSLPISADIGLGTLPISGGEQLAIIHNPEPAIFA